MLRKIALIISLLAPSLTFGQGAFISGTANGTVNGALRTLAGATITICAGSTSGTPCAPALVSVLFKDAALTQPLANPTTTDANGNYNFAMAAGTYTLTITATGFTGTTQQVTVACAAGGCTAGPLTVTNLTVSGTGTFANINTIRYANSLTAGADCVAKLNTLDAAIGASPGEIDIDPSCGTTWTATLVESGPRVYKFLGGGTYTVPLGTLIFTQPTVFDGVSLKSTILIFTGGSGIAMNIQWNTVSTGSYQDWSAGVRNIQLIGPAGISGTVGYAGTALSIGATGKSSLGVLFDNVLAAGFSLGQTWGDTTGLSWGTKTRYTAFYNNAQSVVFNAPNEVVNYDTVTFSPNVSNGYQTSCFSATSAANGGGVTFVNSHFDACQFNAANGTFTFDALTHFENVTQNTTNPFMVFNGGGTGYINGTQFIQTRGSGSVPPEFVQCVACKLTNSGSSFFSNATMTNAVLLDTSAEYHQMGPTSTGGITTPIGNTAGWTGSAIYDNAGSGAAAPTWTVSASGTNIPLIQVCRGSTGAVCSGLRQDDNLGTNGLELINGASTLLQGLPSGLVRFPNSVQIGAVSNFNGLQIFNTTTTCTTGASVGATCTTAAITLPVAEADTSYRVVCTGKGLTNVPVVIATTNSSASQFTITIAALTAAAASFASYDCTAGHN
jgi:hypothetical protein